MCGVRYASRSASECPMDGGELGPPRDPNLGRIVAGRYELVEHRYSGAIGNVHAAWDVRGAREVVLILAARRVRDAEWLARIASPRLLHAGFVFATERGEPCVVFEAFDAIPLQDAIEARGGSVLAGARAARTLARTLAEVHAAGHFMRGHLHARTAWVVRRRKTSGSEVLVATFDLEEERRDMLQVQFVARTAFASEHVGMDAHSKPSASQDVFALGLLAYRITTGQHAWAPGFVGMDAVGGPAPPRPSSIVPEIPPVLDAVLLRLLHPDPACRGSAAQVADDFDRAIQTLKGV